MKNIQVSSLLIMLIMVIMIPSAALGEPMAPRTCPGSIPCDPTTDFKEVFLVPNWANLPRKCQEESLERVNEVNSLIEKKKWSYVKAVPVLTCLSYAASTMADWWGMEYGWPMASYDNFYNGKPENGFNPRELEVTYLSRSKDKWLKYPIIPIPDPVHKRPFPASNRGYARVLTEQADVTLNDTILTDISYSFSKNKYPFENKWLRFKRNLKSNAKFTNELIAIIHAHGPLLSHLEYTKLLRLVLPGVHGVIIIGYGRPSAAPDDIVFIIQDSYGDHPKDYGVRAEGGPSYKYFKAKYLDSVIAFPHKPVVTATRNGEQISLKITNKAGRALKVNRLALWDQANEKVVEISTKADSNDMFKLNSDSFSYDNSDFIRVYVAAEFYMETPKNGHWLKIRVN